MSESKEYFYRHGGPYDRGSADAYYWRPHNPHYYKGSYANSELVTIEFMTEAEIAEYTAGYNETEDRKDWG